MSDIPQFNERNRQFVEQMGQDEKFSSLSKQWLYESAKHEYSYHFTWLGLPIIQYPQDMVAIQEIIWRIKPQLIIETGIARGGSLIFHASILELIGGERQVVGVDIDIRQHNRETIEAHPLFKHITMIQGSSVDPAVVGQVQTLAEGKSPVLVLLDSNHTHEHVLREMQCYAPLVTSSSYLVVLDTLIEEMPDEFVKDRPWGRGNNPQTAVHTFLQTNPQFVIDKEIDNKLGISAAPSGYLRCTRQV